jgi:hypothetical protein
MSRQNSFCLEAAANREAKRLRKNKCNAQCSARNPEKSRESQKNYKEKEEAKAAEERNALAALGLKPKAQRRARQLRRQLKRSMGGERPLCAGECHWEKCLLCMRFYCSGVAHPYFGRSGTAPPAANLPRVSWTDCSRCRPQTRHAAVLCSRVVDKHAAMNL